MMPVQITSPATPVMGNAKLGLRSWMERVLAECTRGEAGLKPEPVHDLRVALRRCRTLADGMMALDPNSAWKALKKASKKLFQELGDLRDLHVMQEWVEKIGEENDPVTARLVDHFRAREKECVTQAFRSVQQFDRKQWREWSHSLPRRAQRIRPGSAVFKHLALEKWTAAHDLHKRALRNRSQAALHQLRIGLKRFRYTVENFLPEQHVAWAGDLKDLQDLLGDIHDLDVLWSTAIEITAFPTPEHRTRWRELVLAERMKRLDRYRQRMVGPESLWKVWRSQLPSGPTLRAAAQARLCFWGRSLDPDPGHSQRIARLALQLFDGLGRAGLLKPIAHEESRSILEMSALLHDVGRSSGEKAHHKNSFKLIRELPVLLGLTQRELSLVAAVARFHRGDLPRSRSKALQALDLLDRKLAVQLSAVLRFADRLDLNGSGAPRVKLEHANNSVTVRIPGYRAQDRSAEDLAAARHLLETVLRRPVIVRATRRDNQRTLNRSKFSD